MQLTHLRAEYWAVEVPSIGFGFQINNYGDESEYMYMVSVEDIIDQPHSDETLIVKKLPKGTWSIVCTSKEATKEQAYEIVEHDWDGFKDYGEIDLSLVPYLSPLDSFRSLLTSKGLDVN